MIPYPKIPSVFKRDEQTHKFIPGEWSSPEIEYLATSDWVATEKVDGTNIRVVWEPDTPVRFAGRTNNSSVPTFLLERLGTLFPPEKFNSFDAMCLYGEGHGARIQRGGANYKADGTDFVLFDVRALGSQDVWWWLGRDNVEDIATQLGIGVVPIRRIDSLWNLLDIVQEGFTSNWGDFPAEGLVLRPQVDLCTRAGHRIITKAKHKDFPTEA